VTGVFSYTMVLGGNTYTAQAGGSDIFLAKLSPSGGVQWFKQGKTSTSGAMANFVTNAAIDAAGNVYFAGSFPRRIDFGSGTILTSSASGYDVFVLKFDAQGTLLWSRTGAATNTGAGGASLAVDAGGNVLVCGSFSDTISFGGTAVNALNGDNDVFLAKLDANGTAQWVRRAGSSGADGSTDVGVDAVGNAYVVGYVSAAATFGSITLNPLGSPTGADLFLAKYSTQGTALWAQRGASTNDDVANAVAVDADGYAVVSGFADGVWVGSTQQNIYTARYSPQGTRLWEQRTTPSQQSFGFGLAGEDVTYDGRGGIYVTGFSNGQLTFGATSIRNTNGAFVVRYDLQGNAVWADKIDGATSSSSASAHSVGTDASGNVYLAGEADGNVYFGPVLSSMASSLIGGIFVARLTAGGPLATVARRMEPLHVFPNPTREYVMLQLPAGGGHVVVYDALGRAVHEQVLPMVAGTSRIELGSLAPGLYRLQATLAGGRLASAPLQLR
jgi:hypothetical protein